MPPPADDSRLTRVLEACYEAIYAGEQPDLDALCGEDRELRATVERMIRREQQMLLACGDGLDHERDAVEEPLPRVPKRIGDFAIREPIGIGGMSHVYRAVQEPLGRDVALKLLRDDLVTSERARLRFMREASITASLDHPNIVPVYAAGESQGTIYLAMKLLRGRSLERLEARQPTDQIVAIGIDVASALEAAHEVGVVHRDLKPANIVLEDGRAFVVDFGLASFINQASLLTQPNSTPGTLLYLPPEVARRRSTGLDPRADVYGCGATIYELLAGHPPFAADNPVRALNQILHHEPPPLGLRGRERDLETIVMRAMDKLPQRRFATAGEMRDELCRYRDGQPILTRRPNPLTRMWRAARRRPMVSSLSAAIVILSATLTLLVMSRRWTEQAEYDRTVTNTEGAIVSGDLAHAARLLTRIESHPLHERATPALRDRYERERRLQFLIAVLQDPVGRADRTLVDELADRVRRDQVATPSPRATAALMLVPGVVVQTPSNDMLESLPRTFVALQARAAGKAAEDALAKQQPTISTPDDHLLAALTIRSERGDEPSIENELRRGDPIRNKGLLLTSLALALEAQDRHAEALDACRQVQDHPICAPFARWTAARLAALLGDRATAQSSMRAALTEPPGESAIRRWIAPVRLAVLRELSDSDSFWQHWRAAEAECGQSMFYWREAGFQAVLEALSNEEGFDIERFEEAEQLFERAHGAATNTLQRCSIDVVRLQLSRMLLDPEGEREPWQRHAEAAEAAARQLTDVANANERLADALVEAAHARLVLGEAARARQLLDRAAELDVPAALAEFAVLAGEFASIYLEGDDETEGLVTLGERHAITVLGLERGNRVLALVANGRPLDAALTQRTRDAVMVCAATLGEARSALPLALSWQPGGGIDAERLRRLSTDLIKSGGILLDNVRVSPPQLAARLHDGVRFLEQIWRAGDFTTKQAHSVIELWRKHEVLQAFEGDALFAPFRQALAAFDKALEGGR